MSKQQQHLAILADAFFEQLIMLELEYGSPGLDPKRPFGNSDVERDILVLLDIDPEGDDGDAECFSSRQREYAADLFKVQLIPFLQKAWVGRNPRVEASPEFTDTARAALLWVLWHHQGGSSPVGQPLRFALGMGQHGALNDHQVAEAKRWAARTGSKTEEFHRGQALPAGDAAMPVVATWRDRVKHLDRPTDFAERNAAVEEARDLRWALEEAYGRIASMRTEWGAEVAALTAQARHAEAEAAKSERRAIEFGDALHRNILAMRAALADSHKHGPHHGMHWIVNTLAGPGQLPDADDVALGGQALFDKEVAEHEAFRAANPGPAAPAATAAQARSA
jgi:hypothetical protein